MMKEAGMTGINTYHKSDQQQTDSGSHQIATRTRTNESKDRCHQQQDNRSELKLTRELPPSSVSFPTIG
jgi:hypothetical protein